MSTNGFITAQTIAKISSVSECDEKAYSSVIENMIQKPSELRDWQLLNLDLALQSLEKTLSEHQREAKEPTTSALPPVESHQLGEQVEAKAIAPSQPHWAEQRAHDLCWLLMQANASQKPPNFPKAIKYGLKLIRGYNPGPIPLNYLTAILSILEAYDHEILSDKNVRAHHLSDERAASLIEGRGVAKITGSEQTFADYLSCLCELSAEKRFAEHDDKVFSSLQKTFGKLKNLEKSGLSRPLILSSYRFFTMAAEKLIQQQKFTEAAEVGMVALSIICANKKSDFDLDPENLKAQAIFQQLKACFKQQPNPLMEVAAYETLLNIFLAAFQSVVQTAEDDELDARSAYGAAEDDGESTFGDVEESKVEKTSAEKLNQDAQKYKREFFATFEELFESKAFRSDPTQSIQIIGKVVAAALQEEGLWADIPRAIFIRPQDLNLLLNGALALLQQRDNKSPTLAISIVRRLIAQTQSESAAVLADALLVNTRTTFTITKVSLSGLVSIIDKNVNWDDHQNATLKLQVQDFLDHQALEKATQAFKQKKSTKELVDIFQNSSNYQVMIEIAEIMMKHRFDNGNPRKFFFWVRSLISLVAKNGTNILTAYPKLADNIAKMAKKFRGWSTQRYSYHEKFIKSIYNKNSPKITDAEKIMMQEDLTQAATDEGLKQNHTQQDKIGKQQLSSNDPERQSVRAVGKKSDAHHKSKHEKSGSDARDQKSEHLDAQSADGDKSPYRVEQFSDDGLGHEGAGRNPGSFGSQRSLSLGSIASQSGQQINLGDNTEYSAGTAVKARNSEQSPISLQREERAQSLPAALPSKMGDAGLPLEEVESALSLHHGGLTSMYARSGRRTASAGDAVATSRVGQKVQLPKLVSS